MRCLYMYILCIISGGLSMKVIRLKDFMQDKLIQEKMAGNTLPDDISYRSMEGNALYTGYIYNRGEKTETQKLIPLQHFLKQYAQSLFVKVNSVTIDTPKGEKEQRYRIACLFDDKSCMEALFCTPETIVNLLSVPEMHMKPALWFGTPIMITQGGLHLHMDDKESTRGIEKEYYDEYDISM